jgi:hypothetical protein
VDSIESIGPLYRFNRPLLFLSSNRGLRFAGSLLTINNYIRGFRFHSTLGLSIVFSPILIYNRFFGLKRLLYRY